MSESNAESPNTEAQSQRQRDLALDAEASRLDTNTDIGERNPSSHATCHGFDLVISWSI